ncbi:HTH domain-containing protein [Streptomyces sp. NPDC006655]|uniref:HTH domain-containing protein n=1 Tax=Streptomyces sp. NPDC006655 TaxID=3156898 RepID=UPI003455AC5D
MRVPTRELASALGGSRRTITRDLNWLRDAGLPVTAHPGRLGGVTMPPGSGLDLTRLTPDERDPFVAHRAGREATCGARRTGRKPTRALQDRGRTATSGP